MMSTKTKISILFIVVITGVVLVFVQPPIRQNTQYHHFSDQANLFSIPNFSNVFSNVLFLIIGFIGILYVVKLILKKSNRYLLINDLVFFIGIFLTGIGSSYYHLHPTNSTLVWDRLPMVITFMAFFSIIIGEYIHQKIGKQLLVPLLSVGLFSVGYWYYTEIIGVGDLRLYILIQFLPLFLILLILLLFRQSKINTQYIIAIILLYILAKVCESFDAEIYRMTHCLSGHTLKHMIASIAPYVYYVKLKKGFY